MYLVDTDILSESMRAAPNRSVLEWLEAHEESIRISTITIGEIQYGIELLASTKRQAELRKWLEILRTRFAESILPIDDAVTLRWGLLRAASQRSGRKLPVVDSLLAATAIEHDLTVVTGNTKDFIHAGVKLLNPH